MTTLMYVLQSTGGLPSGLNGEVRSEDTPTTPPAVVELPLGPYTVRVACPLRQLKIKNL